MAGPRGEYRKSAGRREQILDAALDVFARSGYSAGSVAEIAKTVGITATGVLHHFGGGKPELLAAVLEHRDIRAIVNIEGRHSREFLAGLVEISRIESEQPGLAQLHAMLAAEATEPSHPAHTAFLTRFANITETVRRAYAEIRDEGGLHDGIDPLAAATSTLAMIEGLGLLALYPLQVDAAAALRTHISGFLVDPL